MALNQLQHERCDYYMTTCQTSQVATIFFAKKQLVSTAACSASRREHHAQPLAGGWGRSAPPAPKLDPGAVLARPPPWGAASAVPPIACWTATDSMPPPPAGPGSRGTGLEGGGRPESADTDELTNKLMRIPAPPAPDFSSQDAQPLSPPKGAAPDKWRVCAFRPSTVPLRRCAQPWRHALARDRANQRGIAAQREALWGGAVHHEVEAPAVRCQHSRGRGVR